MKMPATDEQTLAFLLGDVLRRMRQDFRDRAQAQHMTPSLARLLLFVKRQPGCRQAELADFLEVTAVTVGRMIDRLEKQGVVRRVSDAADRRVCRIYLDRASRPIVAQMKKIAALSAARATRGFSPQERSSMVRCLSRMRDNLGAGAR
jgi:MarR family transcriptional regulator, transcriptional regulator for hemolysin